MASLIQTIHTKSSFNPTVILSTLVLLIALVSFTLISPQFAREALHQIQTQVFDSFSWFYVISFSIFLFFLLALSVSSYGNIKLGSNEEEPEYPFFSWIAMLFAAGMGIGLIFFGVAEPLTHSLSSITSGSLEQREQDALLHTIFHWGVHAWAIYGVVALALAYFSFRYKLPLALRSCFYPLFKERLDGRLGHVIDILSLLATLFGITTSLGFGAMQFGAGLTEVGVVSSNSFLLQSVVISLVCCVAVVSAISGIGRGVKFLSELNLTFATLLLIFVLVTGPTLYLFSAFSDNIGVYLSELIKLSFKTYVYEPEQTKWFTHWTVLYWAWWCSWTPFVGLFIARISRGRTIREFVFGVLLIPTLFTILWFTAFGNSAIWFNHNVANGSLGLLVENAEKLLFAFLNYLPFAEITRFMALGIVLLFFITSADSGIYVLNNIASRDDSEKSARWQYIMWGALLVVVACTLLNSGGMATIQSMMLVATLPFVLLVLVICFSLWKALMTDKKYFETEITPTSATWTGERWKDRLNQILNQTQEKDIIKFLKRTALPAMRELRIELIASYGLDVDINTTFDEDEPSVELVVHHDSMRDFMYGIKSVGREISQQLIDDENIPHIQYEETYEPITYFFDGRSGYDVQYMSRDELIADMLKHYERYLFLIDDDIGQERLAHEQTELAE